MKDRKIYFFHCVHCQMGFRKPRDLAEHELKCKEDKEMDDKKINAYIEGLHKRIKEITIPREKFIGNKIAYERAEVEIMVLNKIIEDLRQLGKKGMQFSYLEYMEK